MKRRRVGASVPRGNSKQDLIGVVGFFGGFDEDVPVPILVKHTSVDNLVLLVFLSSAGVLVDQVFVGELFLRVLVEKLHVRMLSWQVSMIVGLESGGLLRSAERVSMRSLGDNY